MSLAPSQGLANFEKCIQKLEQLLPAAIAQQRHRNALSRRQPVSAPSATANDGDDQQPPEHVPAAELDIVEALMNLIRTNYVDDGCNAPPENLAQLKGITAREALSNSYRQLVADFVVLRDRWARAATLPPSSRVSPAGSSRASSRASNDSGRGSNSAGRFRPAGFLAAAPLGASRYARSANANNDDGDDDGQLRQAQHMQRRGVVLLQQHEELPPSEIYRPPAQSAAELRALGEQVRSVRDLQVELNGLVEGQQDRLDSAERSTERAALHVENARKELYTALKHTTLASGIVGGILGCLVGGPAGMALGAQGGMAIAASVVAGGAVGAVTGTKIATSAQENSADAEWNRHAIPGEGAKKVPKQ